MTDAQKIRFWLDLFGVDIEDTPISFKARGRRFFPDKNGEIERITFKLMGHRYTAFPEGISK